jgi:hypothetical protein
VAGEPRAHQARGMTSRSLKAIVFARLAGNFGYRLDPAPLTPMLLSALWIVLGGSIAFPRADRAFADEYSFARVFRRYRLRFT